MCWGTQPRQQILCHCPNSYGRNCKIQLCHMKIK
uniref:Uncharacterized protein n=1 Tax=Anguilla anguilla TaxID=7936 RepID=A0A0E9XEX9_ANGAN